jgi:hypothetical protein
MERKQKMKKSEMRDMYLSCVPFSGQVIELDSFCRNVNSRVVTSERAPQLSGNRPKKNPSSSCDTSMLDGAAHRYLIAKTLYCSPEQEIVDCTVSWLRVFFTESRPLLKMI